MAPVLRPEAELRGSVAPEFAPFGISGLIPHVDERTKNDCSQHLAIFFQGFGSVLHYSLRLDAWQRC